MGATVARGGVPSLGRSHIRRDRLTRLLDETAAQIILLNAPAGYGKTTLVREWLHGQPRVGWYHASSASADVAAFSVGVADAVATFVPGAGERLRQRLRVAEAPEHAVRPLAELLAEDLIAWPEDGWLVVDDYHVVADSAPVEQFVDWLLTLAPVRLVATTRRRPSWASARRILHGEITEVTTEQLAMTDEEASQVLSGRATEERVNALLAQAHGWPALIGLARLSASFEVPTSRISSALFRYFAEEVFRQQPRDVQRFMLAAAVPDSVETRLFPLLVETPGDYPIERLADEGLLREAESGRFRFHPLLRDFLRRKLRAEDPALFGVVADRVIESSRQVGRWDEAIELALDSGEADRAAEILGEAAPTLLAEGRIETIERWLAACGPAALEHPRLVIAKAEVLIRRDELLEAAGLAADTASHLPGEHEEASRAWYLAGRAYLHLSDYELSFECLTNARETAKTDEDAAIACLASVSVAAEFRDERLDRLVAEIERLHPETVDGRLELAATKVLLAARGQTLADAWKWVEPVLGLVKYAHDPVVRSFFLEVAGYVAMCRADYRRSFQLTDDGMRTCHEFRLGPTRTTSSLCWHAAAAIGLRRFRDAEAALNEISRLGIRDARHIAAQQTIMRLKLSLAQGSPQRALATLSSHDASAPRTLLAERAGLLALAAAAVGDADRSRRECEKALGVAPKVEARFYATLSRVVLRIARGESGDTIRAAAVALFRDAVEAEMVDAFVVAYRAYPPLLAVVAEDESSFPLVARVVRAANDQKLAGEVGVLLPEEEPGERLGSLTKREKEVLRLMSDGLSNAEIAKRLFVSESTAKVHVHHILEKLGARTRLQAVLMSK